MCKGYRVFHKAFLYYKTINYTEDIPQNSFQTDLEQAVKFINKVHKLVCMKKNRNFTYYLMMNKFFKKHRVVIGLSALSLTSLVLVRKPAIIAFSNYLALNPPERRKEEITKTKYWKVIEVAADEDYRDTLLINTRVANYLHQKHNLNFGVLIYSF
jgi:hypothetical protein